MKKKADAHLRRAAGTLGKSETSRQELVKILSVVQCAAIYHTRGAKVERQKEAIAVFQAMAEVAEEPAQSVLRNE